MSEGMRTSLFGRTSTGLLIIATQLQLLPPVIDHQCESLSGVEYSGVSFLKCPQFTADTLPSSLPMVYLGQCLSDVVVELFIRRRSTSAAAPIIAPQC